MYRGPPPMGPPMGPMGAPPMGPMGTPPMGPPPIGTQMGPMGTPPMGPMGTPPMGPPSMGMPPPPYPPMPFPPRGPPPHGMGYGGPPPGFVPYPPGPGGPRGPPPPNMMPPHPVMMMQPPKLVVNDIELMQQKLVSVGLDNKVTTVWVGKISPLVEDETVRRLLEACGQVNSWARVEANGQLKSFGFCYFSNAESALRALRLLDNVSIGDESLKLKVDAKTETYLQQYNNKRKDFELQEIAERERTGKPPPQFPWSNREEKDTVAKEVIDKIIESVNRALAEGGEGDGVVSREIRNFREKQAKLEREKRAREEEFDRRRREREEDDKRQAEKRRERAERAYRDKERDWTEHERERDAARQRAETDIRERQLKRKRDTMLDDDDDKARRRKIRSKENRRRRLREKEEDDRDRAHEQYLEDMRRKEERRKEEEEKRRLWEEEQKRLQAQKAEEWQRGQPIKLETKAKEPIAQGKFDESFLSDDNGGSTRDELLIPRQIKTDIKSRVSVSLVGPKRTLTDFKELGFSAEQAEDELLTRKVRLTTLDTEMAKKMLEENAREEAKNVINQIPTEKDQLFEYSINWELVDSKNIVEEKMRPWVAKKIAEFLGEEEPTLIEYICKKLSEHCQPQEILAQLQHVLDDEASIFVIKMWRMLIYVILMA